jgi:hypothetical protein
VCRRGGRGRHATAGPLEDEPRGGGRNHFPSLRTERIQLTKKCVQPFALIRWEPQEEPILPCGRVRCPRGRRLGRRHADRVTSLDGMTREGIAGGGTVRQEPYERRRDEWRCGVECPCTYAERTMLRSPRYVALVAAAVLTACGDGARNDGGSLAADLVPIEKRLAGLRLGMSREQVVQLLPPLEKMESSELRGGSGATLQYRVSPHWSVALNFSEEGLTGWPSLQYESDKKGRVVLRTVRERLLSVVDHVDVSSRALLVEAIAALDAAGGKTMWESDTRLSSSGSTVVFSRVSSVVSALEEIASESPEIGGGITTLVRVARVLATEAIAEAKAPADELAKAAILRGDSHESARRHADAIGAYREAWAAASGGK